MMGGLRASSSSFIVAVLRTHGRSAGWLSSPFLEPHQARCPTKSLPTRSVPSGKRQPEKLPLSQLRSFPKRTNTSYRQVVRFYLRCPRLSFTYSRVIAACQIVQAIKDGQWTSTQIVTAFIKSAIHAQDETNCITEGLWSFLYLQCCTHANPP